MLAKQYRRYRTIHLLLRSNLGQSIFLLARITIPATMRVKKTAVDWAALRIIAG